MAVVSLVAVLGAVAVAWMLGYVSLWQPAVMSPAWPSGRWKARMRTRAEHDALLESRPKPRFPYVLRFEGARGGLVHFGVWHSRKPHDAQFSRMLRDFEAFRPSVVLVETRSRYLHFGGFERRIRQGGEAAAAVFLAERSGVPFYSLEPERADVAAALLKRWRPAQVAMNMTLGTYWGDKDSGRSVSDADAEKLLRQRTALPGLEGALPTVAALDEEWRREFPDLPSWREKKLDSRSSAAAGTWWSDMAVATNEVRDEHWMRLILDLVSRGERVFVVCGGSHTIMQEPVMRAELLALGLRELGQP